MSARNAECVPHPDDEEGGGHGSAGRDAWRESQEELGPWPITRSTEDVRLHLVWIADEQGTFLGSIHATRESASAAAERSAGAWVDSEWKVEP